MSPGRVPVPDALRARLAAAKAHGLAAFEHVTWDPATGAVVVEGDRCLGCRYCTWACPYDSPRFSAASGTVEKCTFCNHRLREGRDPACVSACWR